MSNQRASASRGAIGRARKLRRDSTIPERILWGLLRGAKLGALKFRRQHPLGPYFADYYCHEARLVVELDGMSHDGRGEHDRRREAFLRRMGLNVLRIANDDVLSDLEAVALAILRAAGKTFETVNGPHPDPLPQGEGDSCGPPLGKQRARFPTTLYGQHSYQIARHARERSAAASGAAGSGPA